MAQIPEPPASPHTPPNMRESIATAQAQAQGVAGAVDTTSGASGMVSDMASGVDTASAKDTEDIVSRDPPEPDEKRKQLVEKFTSRVKEARSYWQPVFRRMIRDQKFCAGSQWPEETKSAAFNDDFNDRYVANITLRHVKQRVAAVYAKNPKAVARPRPRIYSTVWDGTQASLAQAQQTLSQAQAAEETRQKLGMGIGLGIAAAQSGVPLQTLTGQPEYKWQDPPVGVAPGAPGAPSGGPPGPNGGGPPQPPPPPPGGGPGGLLGMLQPQEGQPPAFPPPPGPPDDEVAQAQAVLADAKNVKAQVDQINRIARTLEILYGYEISQQQQSFKSRMKLTVRRAATSGVGWVRVGFQRVMGRSPDLDSQLADAEQQMTFVERVSADIADNQTTADSPEAEQMRLTIASLAAQTDIVVREGLMFSWPKPTALIVDKNCTDLRDFLGCEWAAEEYCLTPDEIQQTYKVDVGKQYTAYNVTDAGTDYGRATPSEGRPGTPNPGKDGEQSKALVWEIFNKTDGLVYVVCDGYHDFLREPAEPEFYIDRFWPWFLVAFNECDGEVYPPSDVSLVRPMQLELNRSRQGLREHRFANRPKTGYADGALSQDDIEAMKNPPMNALIAISGLQPGQKVDDVLQAIKGVPIDPNLYQTQEVFQDMLRVAGDQQADLGPTSGATATESNIAAQARATSTGSEIDDIDDTLSAMAQAAGQILLLNVSEDTVREIVGPGAVWPTLTKGEVAKNLILDIEAGSSGRPNQAQELQNFERLAPILMQIPGISPMFLAQQALTRLDDSIDLDAAIADGQPSVLSQNGVQPGASTGQGPGAGNPAAQGPQGRANAPGAPSPQSSAPTPMNAAPPGPPN